MTTKPTLTKPIIPEVNRYEPLAHARQSIRRASTTFAALTLTAALAFGGTASPQLTRMPPSQQVQVIIQYTPSLLGGLTSTVCGVLNLVQILPLGELCTMTVADALNLARNPQVAHISVNNTLKPTDSAVYDYTPQTLQPGSSTAGSANPNVGQNIGVAIIDSGIHVDKDLLGNGSLLSLLFPQVVYAKSFVPNEGVDDYYGHGTHIARDDCRRATQTSPGPAYLHDDSRNRSRSLTSSASRFSTRTENRRTRK